jgi:hypothetical protein
MTDEEANIKDKNGNKVFFGDKFRLATGRIVTVVKDTSPENLDCDRNYDVEDDEGDRVWNAYIVIAHGEKLTNESV